MSLASVVGDDVISEGTEICSGQGLGHVVCLLVTGLGPNKSELFVTTTVMVSEEVVTNTDVTGVF